MILVLGLDPKTSSALLRPSGRVLDLVDGPVWPEVELQVR